MQASWWQHTQSSHQQELWPLRPQRQVVNAAQHSTGISFWVQAEQQLGVLQSCGVQAPSAQVLRRKTPRKFRVYWQPRLTGYSKAVVCRPHQLRVCSAEIKSL